MTRLGATRALFAALLVLHSSVGAQARSWTPEDLSSVRSAARRAQETNPGSWWALNLAGQEKLILRQNQQALKLFGRSYGASPNQESATYLAMLTYSDDSAEGAKWALKALSFQPPSLHALTIFEGCLTAEPSLAAKENADTRRVRAHRERWRSKLKGYRRRVPTLGRDVVDEELAIRKWPAGRVKVSYANGQLTATSPAAKPLWSRQMSQPLHTLVQPETVVLLSAGKVEFLDTNTGITRSVWTAPVPVAFLASRFSSSTSPWTPWESPEEILAADDHRLFVDLGDWLMVLRQAGGNGSEGGQSGGGWAHYFGQSLTAKVHRDTIVCAVNHASICAHHLGNGKELWRVPAPVGGAVDLLDVTDKEAIIYLPSVEQVRALSLSTGATVWTQSHLEI